MLEEHVKKANGQYKLLKIDIDKCGELAGEFQVKALPSLYLFVNGQPIDTLVGIPSESDLERFLQTIDNVLLFEKKNEKTIAVLEEARKLVR